MFVFAKDKWSGSEVKLLPRLGSQENEPQVYSDLVRASVFNVSWPRITRTRNPVKKRPCSHWVHSTIKSPTRSPCSRSSWHWIHFLVSVSVARFSSSFLFFPLYFLHPRRPAGIMVLVHGTSPGYIPWYKTKSKVAWNCRICCIRLHKQTACMDGIKITVPFRSAGRGESCGGFGFSTPSLSPFRSWAVLRRCAFINLCAWSLV